MTPEELRIDAVNFPDEQFRAFVLDSCDADGNGYLSDAEIAEVTWIECGGLGIESLNEELIKRQLHPDFPEAWAPTDEWDKEWSNDRRWS